MHNIKIYHCINCLNALSEYGEGPLCLYQKFCECYSTNGFTPIYLDSSCKHTFRSLNTIIKFLEVKRYLLTCDSHEMDSRIIKLIPLGLCKIDDALFEFCPQDCRDNNYPLPEDLQL